MDDKSTSGEPREQPPPQGEHARLQDAFELLSARRYKHVEHLLQEQQEAAQRSGQMAVVVILAAACQLCLTCRQFQADRELHQLGLEEAARRERESRLQIQAVLTMLSQLTSLETQVKSETSLDLPSAQLEIAGPEEFESDEKPTLIQKVKQLLGFGPTSPLDKSKAGADREDEETKSSPFDQIDSAIALRYLAHELEMLEKTGASLSPEQKLLQAVAASLTASRQQEDDTLESIAYKTHMVEPQQVATQPAQPVQEVESSEENDRLFDQKILPAAINEDEEPMPDDEEPGMPISEQAKPVDTSMMSHVRPEHVSADEDLNLPSIAVCCLGHFRVYQNDRLITSWSGLKGLSILKYLIAREGKPVAKEILMDVFWPDMDIESTRRNLHQAIYSLRQTLRHGLPNFQHILFRNDRYELNLEMELWIDFVELEHHVKAGKRHEADGNIVAAMADYGIAEGLYQGDFLSEDLYETWLLSQRERLRTTYLEAADRLSAYYQQREEHTATIAICQKILGHDNCHETAHRRLMESYLAYGQRHLAIRQYETCFNALAKELDLRPSEETVKLYDLIKLI